ncbi:hypothetical protein [Sharpea azabuensis]|uniref:hypothetical protein n=1 Tax=Sharpea azabuensis TaxID=322505 RepID=UPI00051BF831|nr:hypothetical protein [Sharpea azabuensis]
MDLKVSVALGEGIGYLTSEICTSSDALLLIHLKNTHHHAKLGIAYNDHFIAFYQQHKPSL